MNTKSLSLEVLSPHEQDQLASVLDEYLQCVERGECVSPRELINKYSKYEPFLTQFLSGLNLFHHGIVNHGWDETLPMVPLPMRDDTGQRVGDFQIEREIARGGMGIVYQAIQVSLQRQVALKVLPFTSAHESKQICRFKNEAHAAAQIRHPNIVPVYSVGEENGVHFYAMQLIAGQSLTSTLTHLRTNKQASVASKPIEREQTYKRWSKQERSLNLTTGDAGKCSLSSQGIYDYIRAVARLGIQAADALHAAHEHGIVHRDIKPSNLIIDDEKLWITDFGLAQCRDREGLTETGDILGTLRYMSPEQSQGRNSIVDHRTDIYSLGVTLYELATLHHPAGEKSDLEILANIGINPKRLREWNRHIPIDFETIILKAISEAPADRYETARQMAEDLSLFVEGKPITASAPSVMSRVHKWARRHRGIVYSVAGAMAFSLVAQSYSTWLLAKSNFEKDRALAASQENLHEAHTVLNRFSELGDRLSAIPGAEPIRFQLLEDSLAHYQRFVAKAESEPALATDLALATSKLGMLTEKLGKKEQALTRYRAARDLWAARLSAEPENIEFTSNLALTENNIAMLLADSGHVDDAVTTLRNVETSLNELHENLPVNNDLTIHLATTLNNLGSVLAQRGQETDATEKFQRAIRLYSAVSDDDSASPSVLQGLAATYNNLGSMLKNSPSEHVIEVFQQAVKIQQRLVQQEPLNRSYQAELARTYNNLGYTLVGRQKWHEAEDCYGDAVKLQEHLTKVSPLTPSYRRDLAVSYNNLGMVQCRNQNIADAETSFRRALEMQRLLLSAAPRDAKMLSNLGGVYNNLGLLFEQQEQFAKGELAFQNAIRLQKDACFNAPGNLRFTEMLSNHCVNFANNLRRQKKIAQAEAALEKSQELLTKLGRTP